MTGRGRPRRRAVRAELGRARLHRSGRRRELEAAVRAWGLWADSVRELAEQRLGVADLDDRRVLGDPDTGRRWMLAARFATALRAAGRRCGCRRRCGLPVPAVNAQVGSPHP